MGEKDNPSIEKKQTRSWQEIIGTEVKVLEDNEIRDIFRSSPNVGNLLGAFHENFRRNISLLLSLEEDELLTLVNAHNENVLRWEGGRFLSELDLLANDLSPASDRARFKKVFSLVNSKESKQR